MRSIIISFFLGVLLKVFTLSALAAPIDVYEFPTETDRDRYQKLVEELRCPKCQNQNLTDSNSQIAVDLRGEVARMVQEGKGDREIVDFMVARYGDFVLYRPPVQSNTYVLWLGPSVMFGLGVIVFLVIVLRRSKLDDDED